MDSRGACALGVLLLVTLGCALTAQRAYEQRLETAPAAAQHGVHSERLRQLMRGLDRLAHERLPKSLDVGVERARQVEELADVAQALADSARQISDPTLTEGLDATRRAEFGDYAKQLASRMRTLADEAPELPPEVLRERAAGMAEVCDGCHARFRIPTTDAEP